MYTFEDLSSKIQASDEELKIALNDIGAFQINGILNKNYHNILLK